MRPDRPSGLASDGPAASVAPMRSSADDPLIAEAERLGALAASVFAGRDVRRTRDGRADRRVRHVAARILDARERS